MSSNLEPVIDHIRAHVTRLGFDWPIKLACNHVLDVWQPTGFGLTPKEDRVLIDDPIVLDLAALVLEHQPSGGRFVLADGGLYLMSSESWVEWDEWVESSALLDEAREVIARERTSPPPTKRRGAARSPRSRTSPPRRIATPTSLRERFPDARLHRRIGSTQNPPKGPLSQGGDT